MSVARWLLLALLAGSLACAQRNARGDGTAGDREYTGRVASIGTEGMRQVVLSLDDNSLVHLAGALLPELDRLAGARLRVQGTATTAAPAPGVDVRRYEILEVNGQRPWVGRLTQTGDGFALMDGDSLVARLDQPPPDLVRQVGARVWVTGTETGQGVRVQSFGVIRPAGSAPEPTPRLSPSSIPAPRLAGHPLRRRFQGA